MSKFILAFITMLSLAVAPFGSAAAAMPCDKANVAPMAEMDIASGHSSPVDKCCDPVTKACLSSCSMACVTVADVADRLDITMRPGTIMIAPSLRHLCLAAHEPGWLDPPPKPVA